MSPGVDGALLGLLAVSGLWLAVMSSPPMRRPRLDDRLAPYLRDTAQPSRLLGEERGVTPFPTLERLLGPVVRDLAARVDRVLGGAPPSGVASTRRDVT
jgi:tight adherence protein C